MTNVNARGVLLLNVGYQPIASITIRDAVDLMMRGVVDSVDGIAARLQTPSIVFEVPSILRLRYYVSVPQRKVRWSRRGILKRDNYTCIYCGKSKELHKSEFTVDHILPISQGGKDTWSNTACSCWKCNNRKANRTPHQAGMKMLWEPKRPRVNYLIASGDIPEEWKVYLRIP